MNTNEHTLSRMQELLLKTLKEFDSFCKSYGIEYYAAYGTLIGAVRHKGFIPWDDDLDVFMDKINYKKFLSVKDKMNNPLYAISDYHNANYPYPFAKFYSKECTFMEYPQFPFITGPWIDIFILYEVNEDKEQMHNYYQDVWSVFWKYRKSIARSSFKEIIRDIINVNGLEGFIKLYKKIRYVPFRHKYYHKIDEVFRKIENVNGDKLRCYSDVEHIFFEKEWFSTTIELPFEDMTIMAPVNYDAVLKNSYGDYMQLPPVEKRVGGHNLYFSDFNKVLSLEEVDQIMLQRKQGVKPMSLKVIINEFLHRKGFN